MLKKSIISLILILNFCMSLSFSQEEDTPLKEAIFLERDSQVFKQLLNQAKKEKFSTQTLFEAEFIYTIDLNNLAEIGKLAEKYNLEQLKKEFNQIRSVIFSSKDEYRSVVLFIHAVKSFLNEEDAAFKAQIKEAFWLSPEQAPTFANLITKAKVRELKKNYRLPQNLKFHLQNTKKEITHWGSIIPNQQAILLYCYSPWNDMSFQTADEVKDIHKKCSINNIAHIQHKIETADDAIPENTLYIKDVGSSNAHIWTTETFKFSLLEQLKITQIPTLILIDNSGKILFHGNNSQFNQFFKNQFPTRP